MGKLSAEKLRKLLGCIGKDSRVIIPPLPGYDSGVHLIGDRYIVVSTDPCIGVPQKWFGWLLIHYASSDVALFGAKPEFCTINLLGSLSTKPVTFYKVMNQACNAADELSMSIVTGHTGTYGDMTALVGVCTAYGTVEKERLITPGGARSGDLLLCTKSIGLETAVNFALARRALSKKLFGIRRKELVELVPMQSCVKEALLLSKIDGVHAMHDATEGGFATALNEMAEASNLGFKIDSSAISVSKEVSVLQETFSLSDEEVLAMSSTGTVLAAVSPEAEDDVKRTLQQNDIEARFLGAFTEDMHRIILRNDKRTEFPTDARDPYARILSARV